MAVRGCVIDGLACALSLAYGLRSNSVGQLTGVMISDGIYRP